MKKLLSLLLILTMCLSMVPATAFAAGEEGEPSVPEEAVEPANNEGTGNNEGNEVPDEHVHEYGEPSYSWSEDGNTCTATVNCTGSECAEAITETATVENGQITSVVKIEATATTKGTTTYTATFTDSHFIAQSKDVQDIDVKESATEEKKATSYPWQNLSDDDFAGWVTGGEHDQYITGIQTENRAEEYQLFKTRIGDIQSDDRREEIEDYVTLLFSEETMLTATPHSHGVKDGATSHTFQPWNGRDSFSGSYVYLTQDATRTSLLELSGTVYLCLNGHTLSGPGISLNDNAHVYICDCVGGGKVLSNQSNSSYAIYMHNNGKFTLYSGTIQGEVGIGTFGSNCEINICGGTVEGDDYGIEADHPATITVTGGKISGSHGIGAYDENVTANISNGEVLGTGDNAIDACAGSTVYINGGSVKSTADVYTPAIYNAGSLYVYGGYIQSDKCSDIYNAGCCYLCGNGSTDMISTVYDGLFASDPNKTSYYNGGEVTLTIVSDTDHGNVVCNVKDEETAKLFKLKDGTVGHFTYTNGTLYLEAPQYSGTCGNNLQWDLYQNGDLEIYGSGAMPNYEYSYTQNTTGPWGEYSSLVKNVIIGEGVTQVGSYAFYCMPLESVTFKNTSSLTIGDYAFANCTALTKVDFGSGTIAPGICTFSDCDSLINVTVPKTVIMNGKYNGAGSGYQMFFSCNNLQSATVDCDYIGPYMFESCYKLRTATFTSKSVNFYYLDDSEYPSGNPFNAGGSSTMTVTVKGYDCSKVSDLVDCSSKNVNKAYVNLTYEPIDPDKSSHLNLTHVTAKTATCTENGSIEYWKCADCGKYFSNQNATTQILESSTVIESSGHNYVNHKCSICGALEPGYNYSGSCGENVTWTLDGNGLLTISGSGAMSDYTEQYTNGEYVTTAPWADYADIIEVVKIDGTVTNIGNYAFYNCGSLTSITIADSVKSIGTYAFFKCSGLSNVAIPNGVTSIGNWVFGGCTSLTSITLSDSVTSIGDSAFSGCSGLTNITLPESVTYIGIYAFLGCEALSTMIFKGYAPTISPTAFYNDTLTAYYYHANDPSWDEVINQTFTNANITWVWKNDSITITKQPESCEIQEDDSAVLSVEATCTGTGTLSYCWQCYNKYTKYWEDATDFATSYTDSTFKIDNANMYLNDYQFRCAIICSDGSGVLSNVVGITVNEQYPITITKQPSSKTINEGGKATLTVEASWGKEGTLSYCWQSYNKYTQYWEPATDFAAPYTNSTFTVEDANLFLNDYRFRCVITSPNGNTVTSNVVGITVKEINSVTITKQPVSCEIKEGESATLSVEATTSLGGELTYRWQSYNKYTQYWEDATDFATEYTNPVFTIDDANLFVNDYIFRCVITNHNGNKAISNTVSIMVDEYNPITITKQPESCETMVGGNAVLSIEASYDGTGDLTYCWQSFNQYTRFWENATDFAAPYTNSTFTIEDANLFVNDYRFRCVITDSDGKSVTSNVVRIIVQEVNPITITTQPESCEINEGGNATLSVGASYSGAGTLSYCWQSYNKYTQYWEPATDFAANYTKPSFTIKDATIYLSDYKFRCVVSDSNGRSATSNIVSINVKEINATSGTCGTNLTWTLSDDGVLTIAGSGAMEDYEYSSPSQGIETTTAPWQAFCNEIKAVKIESGVTDLGNWAFAFCPNLTNVTLANSIMSLGAHTFYNCGSLTELAIPVNVTGIEEALLQCCTGLKSISVPSGVTSIGNFAFEGCTALENMTIPSTVESIGNQAFQLCSSLTNVTIPGNVTSIGQYVFGGDTGLTTITFEGNAPSIGGNAFNKDTLTAKYPEKNATWTSTIKLNYGGTVTWEAYTPVKVIASGSCGDNLTWTLTDDGTITVSGTGDMWDWKIGKSPWDSYQFDIKTVKIEDGVTSVGKCAFHNCSYITSVALPDTLKTIGFYAFNWCNALESVTIPASVISIDSQAFRFCYGISGFTVDPQNTSYSTINGVLFNAAEDTLLAYPAGRSGEYTVPDGIKAIGDYAFAYNYKNGLTSVDVPTSVTSIGTHAFYYSMNLESINVNPANTVYSSIDGVLFDAAKKTLIAYPGGKEGGYTVPDGVETIGEDAFAVSGGSLTSVTLPDSVKTIGDLAFGADRAYSKIETVTFTGNAPTFGNSVFAGDTLTARYPNDNSTWTSTVKQNYGGTVTWVGYTSADVVASGTCGDKLTWELTVDGTLTISGTGTMYNYETFDESSFNPAPWNEHKTSIKNVVIKDGVTSIGRCAFCNCESMTDIKIPDSVKSIGSSAFDACSSLESVVIPQNVTGILYGTFAACTSLKEVTIPNGITCIGYRSFIYCNNLENIIIPESVTSIGEYAFYQCNNLENLAIPESVTSIGEHAFYQCDGLKSVTIPCNVTSIGGEAFGHCSNLVSINVDPKNQSFSSIDGVLFSETMIGVDGIRALIQYPCGKSGVCDIPVPYTEIGSNAFSGCTKLTQVTISPTVTTIGIAAFDGCTGLKEVTIPSGDLVNIEDAAFCGCSNLESVTLPEGIKEISFNLFSDCSKLEEVVIPDGVTVIGAAAFSGCSKLAEIVIPNSVTKIDDVAFFGCSSLTSVTIPDNVTAINNMAFAWCRELKEIQFSGTKLPKTIGESAFDSVKAEGQVLLNNVRLLNSNKGDVDNIATLITAGVPEEWFGKHTYSEPTYEWSTDGTSCTIKMSCQDCSLELEISADNIGGKNADGIPYVVYDKANPKYITFNVDPKVKRIDAVPINGGKTVNVFTSKDGVDGDVVMDIDAFQNNIPSAVYDLQFEFVNGYTMTDKLHLYVLPKLVKLVAKSDYTDAASTIETKDLENIGTEVSTYTIGSGAYIYAMVSELPDRIGISADSSGENVTWLDYYEGMVDEEKTFLKDNNRVYIVIDSANLDRLSAGEYSIALDFGGLTESVNLTIADDSGTCGTGLTWAFYNGTLIISGNGTMGDYTVGQGTPWKALKDDITKVVIKDGVTNIGNYAFYDCGNLLSVEIADSVTTIGEGTFDWCNKLPTIQLPENVTSIGTDAFRTCSKLESINIPKGVKTIAFGAFEGCTSLKNVVIPNGVTVIDMYAFSRCTSLESITIPDSVEIIDDAAFSECSSLKTIEIPEKIETIHMYAFSKCTGLTSFTIPENVKKIEGYAFSKCSGLTSMVIPDNVTYIGINAFGECTALKSVEFLGDAPTIADDSFTNVTSTVVYDSSYSSWNGVVNKQFGGNLIWEDKNGTTIKAEDLNISAGATVNIDGVSYTVDAEGKIVVPEGSSPKIITIEGSYAPSSDVHTQYPTSVKVYIMAKDEDGNLVPKEETALNDCLQYKGSSIRFTGVKGIRMITGVPDSLKSALIAGSVDGYTLEEYGTLLAWASDISDGSPLVLGASYVKSNYAYKKGVADPVFKSVGGMVQYTNVITFGDDMSKCVNDLAMRPYMILSKDGETITIYGGIVYRNIGYVAYQNRDAFEKGSAAYNYIHQIIDYVYPNGYESNNEWTDPAK